MRQEDKDEIWHLARALPLECLQDSLKYCDYNRTVLLDGRVVCIFGVGGQKGGTGTPWMLASPLLKNIGKSFLRESKAFLDEMSQEYSMLYNVAWSKNEVHIKWLQWLGFEIRPATPMGPDGELFHEFYKVT